jgi:ABC-type oligopeptide transport system substrate-binding subunit
MRSSIIALCLFLSCQTQKVEAPPPAPTPQTASAPSSLVVPALLPEMRLARVSAPRSFNPTYLSDTEDERLATALFSPLVQCDPQTYEPKPGLVASWKSFDNNQRWQITLKPNLFFSNQEPLNADDLLSTWLRLIDHNLPSRVSFLLDPVQNARSYQNGERLKAKESISEGGVSFSADEPLFAVLSEISEVTQKTSLYDEIGSKALGDILPGDVVILVEPEKIEEKQELLKVKILSSSATLSGVSLEGHIKRKLLRPLYGPTLRALVKLSTKTYSFAKSDSPELDNLRAGEVVAPIPGEFAVQVGDKKMMMLRDATGTFVGWAETSSLEIRTFSAEKVLVRSLDGTRQAWVSAKKVTYDPSQVGLKKIDPLTVEMTFTKPTGYVPNMLCRIQLTATPQSLIEREGYSWSAPETLASSGPFVLEKPIARGGVSLKPNTLWHQKTLNISNLTIYRLADTNSAASEAAINEYRASNLEALFLETWTIDTNTRSDMFFRSDHTSIKSWQGYYLRVNTSRDELKDVKVRQALASAIDREQLRYALSPTPALFHSLRAQQSFTPKFPGYPEPSGPPNLKEEAKKLWSEATRRPKKLQFYSPDWALARDIVPELCSQWKDVLGVDVEVTYLPWRDILTRNKLGEYDILLSSWLGDFPDPNTFVAMISAGSPENSMSWESVTFEDALRSAEEESDYKKRLEKLSKAEEILLKEAPLIPLFGESEYIWVNERLKGMHPNPMGLIEWEKIRIEE